MFAGAWRMSASNSRHCPILCFPTRESGLQQQLWTAARQLAICSCMGAACLRHSHISTWPAGVCCECLANRPKSNLGKLQLLRCCLGHILCLDSQCLDTSLNQWMPGVSPHKLVICPQWRHYLFVLIQRLSIANDLTDLITYTPLE